jgi:hypothetical protein
VTELAHVATQGETQNDGRNDFDFFLGAWDSKQRKLKQVLVGCDEWEEFKGSSVAHKILDGLGHVDEVTLETPTRRVVGFTLRLFDPQTRLWSIYWASSTHSGPHGSLAPQVGRFEDGRGEFYDHETLAGRSIFVRYLWTSSGPDACRWEQAFSPDGGRTWETNWIADFVRRKDTGK